MKDIQAPKENIRHSILREAKAEFFIKGFHGANIRNIAGRCGISVGNVYNYFAGKNDIFRALVFRTADEIENIIIEHGKKEYLKKPEVWGHEYHMTIVKDIADYIDTNREPMKLLLFHSHGSDFENFREKVTEQFTKSWIVFFKWLNEEYPGNGVNVSDFFLHNMASFYLNVVAEILMHDIPYSSMLTYLEEMMEFVFQGWKPLMNWYKFLPWSVE